MYFAAYSPDSKRIATAGEDRTVRLWDAETGAPIQTLTGHTDKVRFAVYSPDGKTLMSAGNDAAARLWNAQTGKPIHTLRGHTSYVVSGAFTPDSKRIATGSSDQTIRLWDAETGKPIQTIHGHMGEVRTLQYSSDGETLASGAEDDTIRFWNAETGNHLKTVTGHAHFVTSIAYSPDGNRFASASDDQTIRIWDVKTGSALHTLSGHESYVVTVAYSPDGKRLASACWDTTIRIWNAKTGAHLQTLEGHRSKELRAVAYSPDGKTARHRRRQTRGLRLGREDRRFSLEAGRSAQPCARRLFFAGRQNAGGRKQPRRLALERADEDPIFDRSWGIRARWRTLSFRRTASGSPPSEWTTRRGYGTPRLAGCSTPLEDMSVLCMLSPIRRTARRSLQADRTRPYGSGTPQTGQHLKTLGNKKAVVYDVAFSPDGKTLAWAGGGAVHLWDVHAGASLKTLSAGAGKIYAAAFSS